MAKRIIILLLLMGRFALVQAQKGEKSITAGPLISFPLATETRSGESDLETGIGLEAIGQYNVSENSAILLKTTLASWRYKKGVIGYEISRLTFLTVQAGYKYRFSTSGFFINGLAGTDIELRDGFTTICFTLGAGKRFIIRDNRFIDAGVDLVAGDSEGRLNFKALFNIFHRTKKNQY